MLPEKDITDEHSLKMIEIFAKINDRSVWSKVKNIEDFTVKRFEEGYVNDICACILTEEAKARLSPTKADPLAVVVKIFPKNPNAPNSDPVQRALIHSTISSSGFGPKLLFMDADCCVNEYFFNGRDHQFEDNFDDDLIAQILRGIAGFHYMNVPITNSIDKWSVGLKAFRDRTPGVKEVFDGTLEKYLTEDKEFSSQAELFKGLKFSEMFEYFPEAASKIGSPILFTHMDLHRSNRMITTETLPDGSSKKRFHFIDFDTATYAYRGLDIGCFFCTYVMKDESSSEDLVGDAKMLELIEIYRQECARICGEDYLLDEQNSAEKILREAKFSMMYYFFIYNFFGMFMYCRDRMKAKTREYLPKVFNRIKVMKKFLKEYREQGILPDIGIDIFTAE